MIKLGVLGDDLLIKLGVLGDDINLCHNINETELPWNTGAELEVS